MRYRDKKFYWTYRRGVGWPNDYIGPDSMTRWILEKSVGFTDVGLLRISESVRAYAYLILSSQASARSSIVGNTASALTAQSAFLTNFENVVNRRVNIQEDIKRYQDTLSYASSKVDYSVGALSEFFSGGGGGKPCPLGVALQLWKNGNFGRVGDKKMFKMYKKAGVGREGDI